MNSVEALLAHPQLAARDRWREVDSPIGPIRAPLPPIDIQGVDPALGRLPALGEHTDAILAELGFDGAVVAALRAAGVVGGRLGKGARERADPGAGHLDLTRALLERSGPGGAGGVVGGGLEAEQRRLALEHGAVARRGGRPDPRPGPHEREPEREREAVQECAPAIRGAVTGRTDHVSHGGRDERETARRGERDHAPEERDDEPELGDALGGLGRRADGDPDPQSVKLIGTGR